MALKRRKAPRSNGERKVERIESIPSDVVLAPQAEAPRERGAWDRQRRFANSPKEMSWMEFDRLVQGLARDIKKGFKPDAIVGVAHGGVFVGGAIASALSVDFYPVRISRRSRDKTLTREKKPKLTGDMPKELKGQRVLVVDDVASSGDTLELARALLEKVGAKAIATACLVTREDGFQPEYSSISSDQLIVFPWDYDLVDDERFAPK